MHVHAAHTVHALPDLRVAAGRFAGRCPLVTLTPFSRLKGSDRIPISGVFLSSFTGMNLDHFR